MTTVRMLWEYTIDTWGIPGVALSPFFWHGTAKETALFGERGSEGWELVQVLTFSGNDTVAYYWKRPKEEESHG